MVPFGGNRADTFEDAQPPIAQRYIDPRQADKPTDVLPDRVGFLDRRRES